MLEERFEKRLKIEGIKRLWLSKNVGSANKNVACQIMLMNHTKCKNQLYIFKILF